MANENQRRSENQPTRGYVAFIVLSFVVTLGTAVIDARGPSDAKGTGTKALGAIELSEEVDSVSGRQLRARSVTIEAGGHTTAHSHKGPADPGIRGPRHRHRDSQRRRDSARSRRDCDGDQGGLALVGEPWHRAGGAGAGGRVQAGNIGCPSMRETTA
jgi:hypothetical protein